jgi:hypothetical protein
MGIVMEMVKLLEWVSGKYKDVMEINWDSKMGIVVKSVRFWEKYKKAIEINWDAGMGIVMEMVKLLEGVLGKYKDVMELVKFWECMSEEYKDVMEIN